MTTTADEHRDKAFDSVNTAIKELSMIIIERCSGHDEYTQAYRDNLVDCMNRLIKIRYDIDPRG